MPKISHIEGEDREDLLEALRSACFHLARCWDALRDAEGFLDGDEIETDDIEVITGDLGPAEEAFRISWESFVAWLEEEPNAAD